MFLNMDATSAEDEIKNFVKNLQFVADRVRLDDDEEHVAVKLLAFGSKDSDHHADWSDQLDLDKYNLVFGTKYGFYTESFIIPSTDSAVKLSRFLERAEIEQCENKGRFA
jgi:hypothetical protein